MKDALFGFAIGGIVVAAGFLFIAPTQQPALGAAAGTTHSNHEYFQSGATLGGRTVATTSQGAVTYTASSFTDTSLIQHTATGALTATLPASSTLANFVPKSGDTRTICINAITTKITLAGSTGVDLNTASSTKDIIAGGLGCISFVRKSNSDIEALLTTGI